MFRTTRCTLAVASMGLTFVACQDAARPVRPGSSSSSAVRPLMAQVDDQASLVLHLVDPRVTDPEITWVPAVDPQLAKHYVWLDPSVRGNPKLLVFMPGANNVPGSWQLLEQEAARLGYHVIGLVYQNDVEVVVPCGGSFNPSGHSLDPNCSGNQRLEVLTGADVSATVSVTPANSIDNRLAKVLGYLADQFPAEGWSRFLEDDGTPKWSQIAVSGTSQGAGEAALIGKLRHVDRVVMLSGPPEQRVPEQVDPWMSIGETPAAKYFALFHNRDHLVVGIRLNLPAFDMERFGAPVQAELSEPPYGGTHILFTDLRPTLGYDRPNPHQSTAKDTNTPLGPDGTPLLRDAWRYLLGEPPHGGPDVAAGHPRH
jgi:hypothetical protein